MMFHHSLKEEDKKKHFCNGISRWNQSSSPVDENDEKDVGDDRLQQTNDNIALKDGDKKNHCYKSTSHCNQPPSPVDNNGQEEGGDDRPHGGEVIGEEGGGGQQDQEDQWQVGQLLHQEPF